MTGRHKTRDGKELLIVNMDDSHLLNTLMLYAQKIHEVYETKVVDPAVATMYRSRTNRMDVYSVTRVSEEQKLEAISTMAKAIEPYMAELAMREHLLHGKIARGVREILDKCLRRKEARSYDIQHESAGVKLISEGINISLDGEAFDEYDEDAEEYS